jgi:transposase-like protein
MKKTRFYRRADGDDPPRSRPKAVAEVAKRHGISDQTIYAWRRHYNGVRPHSSLGYLTPAAFKAKHLLNNAPRSVVRTDDIL